VRRFWLFLTDFELERARQRCLNDLARPTNDDVQRAFYRERIAELEQEQATRRAEYNAKADKAGQEVAL
jgi:hypothetical protein